MSENTDTTEAAEVEPIADADQDATGTNVPVDGDGRSERGGNKEARYRVERNEARAERDALSERLATMQRREAERLAAEHLAAGEDLWRDGLDVAALLDEQGDLDPTKVAEAAQAIRTAHPHWGASRVPRPNPASRRGELASGATGRDAHRPPVSWSGLLNTRSGMD